MDALFKEDFDAVARHKMVKTAQIIKLCDCFLHSHVLELKPCRKSDVWIFISVVPSIFE